MNVKIEKHLEDIIIFLNKFEKLGNSHMIDYFANDISLCVLPNEISEEISSNTKSAVSSLLGISKDETLIHLNTFIEESESFILHNMKSVCVDKETFLNKINDSTKNDLKNHVFQGFMSSKKAHETEILSKIACILYKNEDVTHFVDIGDGKGYLSSFLAFNSHIPVLGIDSCQIKTEGSAERAHKLQKNWNGFIKSPKQCKQSNNVKEFYKRVTQFVTEETDIRKLVEDNFSEQNTKIGLLGLHTCGNLGASALKIFLKNSDINCVCNVSCCYHLLTEFDENERKTFYFPLSQFLINKKFNLGRKIRMLAAQSLQRILNNIELPKKTNFYRSILQVLLKKYNITDFNAGKVKIYKTFQEYAQIVLKKLNLDVSENELTQIFDLFKNRENEFNAFYLMRCYIAPAIEALILLDRLMYLLENGAECSYLVHLFDPVTSPRCYGIISIKNQG